MIQTEEQERLRGLLVEAGRRARERHHAVHIIRDQEGDLCASDFVPIRTRRRDWIKVGPAGNIMDGRTGERLGEVRDFEPS
jgi:hypothetical protein